MKKIFKKIIRILFLISLAIAIFLYFIGMLKDNQTLCTNYIVQIDNYHKIHGEYPPNLKLFKKSLIDFRYNAHDCGYKHNDKSYSFFAYDGFMGVVGYDSISKKWWYD